jgi:hypothetical protein
MRRTELIVRESEIPVERYDPMQTPNPEEWLLLDEDERALLVGEYHRRHRLRAPGSKLHAMFHAIVETQIALEPDGVVARTLARLQREGLDRHEALHAVGSVLVDHVHGAIRNPDRDRNVGEEYLKSLETLTAESWRRSG